ncbi:hypothetical protein AAC387_Pa07g3486 [Persea americana]
MCGLSYAQIGGKAANAALPPLKTAEKLQVQDFLHSERRKTSRCSFTAAGNGGKAAGAGFLHSQRRKTCRCSFAAVSSGGKAAPAGFPPLRVEEILQVRVCLSLSGDKAVA